MEVQVIASLIGVGGITLSALLGGFGYFFKVRAESLKVTRQTLFYLLEFRAHTLASAFDSSELYDQYIKRCEKYFEQKKIEGIEFPAENKQLMLAFFSTLIEQITPQLSSDFIEGYENTIVNLAKEKPILAYKVRGKEVSSKMVNVQKIYLEQVQNTELFRLDNGIGEFLKKQVSEVHNKGLSEILKVIEEDLLLVSKACGFIHYLKVRSIVKKRIKPSMSMDEINIEEMFDGMFIAFSKHVSKDVEHAEENG
ncbi:MULTISPECIES: hypothetical protein [Vibrio harveyi group]|uniref:hypothetical protein n=1 Tax=Vibrio harveyi group TaxID=717610 RepID=UPI0003E1D974|nr:MULTISPECIES: hypothetical protein [Vibrio harveyi group]EGQ7665379.1 hypothetical protein [Vibrio parahaemolyticus]EGQ7830810.1 hypothetical protein [Vibrio parahaemolyticus]EGQ8061914.1 hypothetical protein [Vibrio parahaemolyticus]EGR0036471.1 hypothetical protein [Vibrio parahaemolyticus]EGR0204819.1 hypothetical protein [Vibrio parahaemolyticus]